MISVEGEKIPFIERVNPGTSGEEAGHMRTEAHARTYTNTHTHTHTRAHSGQL